MLRTVHTGGTDIHITGRPNGGYRLTQGRSYVLINPAEARELAAVLNDLISENISAG